MQINHLYSSNQVSTTVITDVFNEGDLANNGSYTELQQ